MASKTKIEGKKMTQKKPLYKKIFRKFRNGLFLIFGYRFFQNCILKFSVKSLDKIFQGLVSETMHPVIIYVSAYDWFSKIKQRPNHMFKIFAEKKYPCIFCGSTKTVKTEYKYLHIIPYKYLKYILRGNFQKVFVVSFSYPYQKLGNFMKYISDTDLVIYELIDDWELLGNSKVISFAKKMYLELIKRKNTYVLASAQKLYQLALEMGTPKEKLFLNRNAVSLQDFQRSKYVCPENFKAIVSKKKPIIGYYGALTTEWFDFETVQNLVEKHPELEFVLIGYVYCTFAEKETNEWIEKLNMYPNFSYLPAVNYSEIPDYAHWWNVAIIPFKINEITKGTSPVKLFEYMAQELPIVTTDLPECKLYKSVFVAKSVADFSKKIELALPKSSDKEYLQLLKEDALNNTWEKRCDDLLKLIS